MPSSPMVQPDELGRVPLFSGLATEQLQRLLAHHRLLTLERDQLLILEKEESQALFVVRSGVLKVRCMGWNGEEAVLALVGAGEVCGEMACLNPMGQRSADVITLMPCSLLLLRATPFAALLRVDAGLALALAKLQAERLRDLHRRFSLRGADAPTRMLATLVDLAAKVAPDTGPLAPLPPLPHRELACLSGLARETASRVLSQLKKSGVVAEASNGGLRLMDLDALRRRGLL
ncbi:MAG: Crp/Fnr family transcriptional regulator [Cyanobacteriota bacterium]|nr:Crp/Fnr family transcriptional regulator [Cyanobacteriota bacterium]